MTQVPMREPIGIRDVAALATLMVLAVAVPLWFAAVAGSIGIPALDDWVYTRGAESLYRNGFIDMQGHTAAALGQLVIVQPLLWLSRGDPWAFTAFGLAMGAIGIGATFLLARQYVATDSAALVAALVLVFPGHARESATFMTDVPAYALTMLCLLLATRWLQGGARRSALLLSLLVGLLAVSIREFAIAAPIAVLAVAWARSRSDDRSWLLALSALFVVGMGLLVTATGSAADRAGAPTAGIWGLALVGPQVATLAAVLLPALLLGIGLRLGAIRADLILLAAGLAGLAMIVPWGLAPGNLWTLIGLSGDLLLSGQRGAVVNQPAWAMSGQVVAFAAMLLGVFAIRWAQHNVRFRHGRSTAPAAAARVLRMSDGLLVVFVVVYAAELLAFAPFWIYDRYLVPIIPAAAILLLRGADQIPQFARSRALAHAALAWLTVWAFVIAANSFAYDAARWRAGLAAVAAGYDARTVDAGYEWVGFHALGDAPTNAPANNMIWSDDRWSLIRPCAVVSNSPLDGAGLRLIKLDRAAYRQYLLAGSAQPLYLYGVMKEGCPPVPQQ